MSAPRTMTVAEACRDFEELLRHTRGGGEIQIVDQGAVVARVLPAAPATSHRRVFGVDRDKIKIADDFGAVPDDFDPYLP